MEDERKVTVQVKANGPVIIDGEFEFISSDDKKIKATRIVLCRCGASGKMPFCDASHNRVGFLAE